MSVFLRISSCWHIGSQTTSRIPLGHFRDTSWSVQQRQVDGPRWTLGLWYMVTAITWLRQVDPTMSDSRWRLSFKIIWSLWNLSRYIPHNKYNLYSQAAFASHLWTDMFQPTGHHEGLTSSRFIRRVGSLLFHLSTYIKQCRRERETLTYYFINFYQFW